MRIHRDERGQTILLVAFSLPLLLGFIGIATDVGALFKDKRTLQTAADAAAIAGALNINNPSGYVTAAKNASAKNGFTDGTNGVTVTVNDPPTWPDSNYLSPTGTSNGYIEVTITKKEPTIFLALFGYPSINVLARAVASNGGPTAACIYTLGENQNDLTIPTGVGISATQCGLVVDSNASPPMNVTGTLTMKSIGTVGSCSGGCGGGTITPNPVPNIVPYSDPLSYLPQFTCNGASCTNGSTTLPCIANPNISGATPVTLTQGCYNGLTISGSSTITFTAGIYVINGNMTFQGNNILTGTGVTFYINSGVININNFTTLNFYAPNAPGTTYNGILFAQNPTATNQTINAIAGSVLGGIMYFPTSNLTINTTNEGASFYTDFVAQSLTFNITPSNNNSIILRDYSSLPGVTSSPLGSVVLVE